MEAMNLRKIKEGRKYRRQRLNSHSFSAQETQQAAQANLIGMCLVVAPGGR